MSIHTGFKKHQKILIILKSGEYIIDKYVDTKAKYLILKEHKKINLNSIRCTTIYRQQHKP